MSASDTSEAIGQLRTTQVRMIERRSCVEDEKDLIFENPPHMFSTAVDLLPAVPFTQSQEINTGTFALKYGVSENAPLMQYEQWLLQALLKVEHYTEHKSSAVRLKAVTVRSRLEEAITEVESWKKSEWECQRVRAVTRATGGVFLTDQNRTTVATGDSRLTFPFNLPC